MIAVLSVSHVVRLKAVAGVEMIGFIAGEQRVPEKLAWIATLGVLPDYRRQGIASALLSTCEAQLTMPRIRLTVRAENLAAQQLYQNFGYYKVGYWPDYYNGGGNALVFEKNNRA